MKNATARITKDRLADGEWIEDRTGKTFTFGDGCSAGSALLEAGGKRSHWSLWDDDGICYYEGIVWAEDEDALDHALERLWEWGAYDSGTVLLKQDGEVVFA